MLNKLILTIIGLVVFVHLYEFLHGMYRQMERQNIFKQAKNRSIKMKRPLLVYGDPYNGKGSKFFNRFIKGYGCGDETVDLTGCLKCKNGVKSDMLKHLKTKASNSQVIFVSCVLEYLDDIEDVFKEMKRVAGGFENIFVVSVNEFSLAAYFYQDSNHSSKNLIYGPPKFKDLRYKKLCINVH